MASIITLWKDSVKEFGEAQLETSQAPDDYCELLELSIFFSGGMDCLPVESISDIQEQFACLLDVIVYS